MAYDINYFIEAKNNIDFNNIDINLKNKVETIFSTHDCFKEQKYNKFNSGKSNINRFRSNKGKYRKSNNIPKINISRKKNRTDVEIILSYLNKLTHTNYDDLSNKICENICEDNYNKILDKLYDISYKQPSYSELYLLLYKKIINKTDDKVLVNNIITKLHNKCINVINNDDNELQLIDKHVNKTDLDYNEFCNVNKNAKHLKGKISIISNLIKNEIITLDKNILINTLFKYENYENEVFLELLQIINNILLLDDSKIEVLKNYVNTANFKGKMMLKFKLKDIIENKIIKPF